MSDNDIIIVDGHAVVPKGLKTIHNGMFRGCSNLTEIIIPDGVRGIGKEAFYGCVSLSKVVLPESLSYIEDSAFEGCSSLETLTVPDMVRVIGPRAFSRCTSLKTLVLPPKMTVLGDAVFDGCEALEKIDIPNWITSVGPWVFNGCSSIHVHLSSTVKEFQPLKTYGRSRGEIGIKELSVSPSNPVLTVEANCLINKRKHELLHMLDEATEFPAGIKSINITDCFLPRLLDIEELVLPEGVTHISALPFKLMKKLKKLVLPSTLQSFDDDFLNEYPLFSISVKPGILLLDSFKPWRELCRADLIGIDSVSDSLKKMITRKFRINHWTDRILSVYFGDQLIYPPANVLKAKEEERAHADVIEAEREKKESTTSFDRKKEEIVSKVEDTTLASLCKATFDPGGFKYYYSEFNNTVSVVVFDSLILKCDLKMETVQEDLAFLLDVATSYRNALYPYFSAAPDGRIKCQWYTQYTPYYQEGMKFISGMPFTVDDISVHLSVDEDSAEAAFLALENLGNAYRLLSQKYEDRMGKIRFEIGWRY